MKKRRYKLSRVLARVRRNLEGLSVKKEANLSASEMTGIEEGMGEEYLR